MTDRKTASTINDAELDQLYDQLAALRTVARGYCPACGRGDAAPTAHHWEEQKQRADQAEELLSIAHDTSNKSEAERARASAVIARVRALHQPVGVVAAAEFGNPPDCAVCGPNTWPCPTYNAIADDKPALAAATEATDDQQRADQLARILAVVLSEFRPEPGTTLATAVVDTSTLHRWQTILDGDPTPPATTDAQEQPALAIPHEMATTLHRTLGQLLGDQDAQAIGRLRELHHDEYGSCAECTHESSVLWPCPTIRAIDTQEQPRV